MGVEVVLQALMGIVSILPRSYMLAPWKLLQLFCTMAVAIMQFCFAKHEHILNAAGLDVSGTLSFLLQTCRVLENESD